PGFADRGTPDGGVGPVRRGVSHRVRARLRGVDRLNGWAGFRPTVSAAGTLQPNGNGSTGEPARARPGRRAAASATRAGPGVRVATGVRAGTRVRLATGVRAGTRVRLAARVRPGTRVRLATGVRAGTRVRLATRVRPGTRVRLATRVRPAAGVRAATAQWRPAGVRAAPGVRAATAQWRPAGVRAAPGVRPAAWLSAARAGLRPVAVTRWEAERGPGRLHPDRARARARGRRIPPLPPSDRRGTDRRLGLPGLGRPGRRARPG